MGFAGNTRERKVIASPRGCAKECSVLIYNANFALPCGDRGSGVWPPGQTPGRARTYRRAEPVLILLVCEIGMYKSHDL
jgi:hypothetical protein